MTGEVGFIVHSDDPLFFIKVDEYAEVMDPTRFASLECRVNNEFLCFQFIQMIKQYGFVQTGQKLEKYETPDSDLFQYLIPIMNHSGE